MTITLNADYDVTLNTALLGYVGETNARPVMFEGLTVDGADRYVLTIDYGDGTAYEVDITGGQWTPTADILRSAQTVSCQICAKKLSGNEYILLKKSRIFRLRIGAAIGDVAVPSPDVAMDALDRIDAIGRQTHADMQTAVTAAETAKTAAENAEKSATAAEKSADTAGQAAKRAETAQASAETSATQAETARQGAETARAEAVTSQNNAKISAAQAAASAQQTTADKNITAGYAKTAKTNADSTTADKQAVQTLAEQVIADKATVADHAAKVATDRKAAETAAQTAQSIADSLPDDYVTAVGKIAENTAEIANVKLTDKELKRRVDALYSIGQGITHKFETDTNTAYQKTVPTGGKLMSVKNIGGRSIVWNQVFETYSGTNNGVTVTTETDGTITLNGTAESSYIYFKSLSSAQNKIGKYILKLLILNNPDSITMRYAYFNRTITTPAVDKGTASVLVNQTATDIELQKVAGISGFTTGTVFNDVKIKIQIFDLTAMFGAGNEPASVEEFEAMFPNDYYQYNAGEIVSAGTESVVEQGANLCDPTIFAATYPDCISVKDDIIDIISGKTAMFESGVALKIPQGYRMTVIPVSKENGAINGRIRALFSDGNIRDIYITDGNGLPKSATNYVAEKDISAIAFNWSAIKGGYSFKMQITRNATDSFTPYHRTTYPIPETIRNLPGYGWSAGTARNYVDYENKRYVQCVSSVDLGTLTFTLINGRFFVHTSNSFDGLIKKPSSTTQCLNAICSQFTAISYADNWADHTVTCYVTENEKRILFIDKSYTDAAEFKQAMQGVIMYYELATPIVTDISDIIPDDFLRNIEVEAGGSVTFKNSNDNYHIPVPSEEEYVVKLSEIGGTT